MIKNMKKGHSGSSSGGNKKRSFDGQLPSTSTHWIIENGIVKADSDVMKKWGIEWARPTWFHGMILFPYMFFLVTLGYLWGAQTCMFELRECRKGESFLRIALEDATEAAATAANSLVNAGCGFFFSW